MIEFLERLGPHGDDEWMDDLLPSRYWATFRDSAVSPLGIVYAGLPASTGDLERAWGSSPLFILEVQSPRANFSSAAFVVDGRERLSPQLEVGIVFFWWNVFFNFAFICLFLGNLFLIIIYLFLGGICFSV